MPPNASKHLLRWGLGEFLDELHEEAPYFKVRRWKDGRIIGKMETETHLERSGGPYVQIHRADLQQALIKVALRHNVKISTMSRIVDFDTSKPAMILEDGKIIEEDLILAADG